MIRCERYSITEKLKIEKWFGDLQFQYIDQESPAFDNESKLDHYMRNNTEILKYEHGEIQMYQDAETKALKWIVGPATSMAKALVIRVEKVKEEALRLADFGHLL